MKHWKALSPGRRHLALAAVGTPLLGFLLVFGTSFLLNGRRLPPLSPGLAAICLLPAAALLLGIINLLLIWTGHDPKKDGWDSLLILSLLPSLLFVGFGLLVLTLPLWFPRQR